MALIHSRIRRLVYMRDNLKFGALESHFRMHESPILNHNFEAFKYIPN